MLDFLYKWIQNLVCYLIIFTAVMEIIPGESYKKYIRFFYGLVMILVLMTPVLKLAGMEQSFADVYHSYEYEQEKREIEEQEKYFEEVEILDFLPEEWTYGE